MIEAGLFYLGDPDGLYAFEPEAQARAVGVMLARMGWTAKSKRTGSAVIDAFREDVG